MRGNVFSFDIRFFQRTGGIRIHVVYNENRPITPKAEVHLKAPRIIKRISDGSLVKVCEELGIFIIQNTAVVSAAPINSSF